MPVPRNAMVLAAGLGQRMRPLTLDKPKPLVRLAGKPLIDHVLDRLSMAGVSKAVVNVHYLPDQLIAHVAARTRPAITISDERDLLLDTGGGIVKALPQLGALPFFHVNSDTVWSEQGASALKRMAQAFKPGSMDMLLLLASRDRTFGFDGRGDFLLDAAGRLVRRPHEVTAAPAYMGVAILDPRIFAGAPAGPFSLNMLFDRAIARGRLFGMLHDGEWLHVGTPQALAEAEARLADWPTAGNDAI